MSRPQKINPLTTKISKVIERIVALQDAEIVSLSEQQIS